MAVFTASLIPDSGRFTNVSSVFWDPGRQLTTVMRAD